MEVIELFSINDLRLHMDASVHLHHALKDEAILFGKCMIARKTRLKLFVSSEKLSCRHKGDFDSESLCWFFSRSLKMST